MSMTTPRVTVPVEPEYTATDYLRLIAEGWEVIESTGSQMTIQNPEDDGPQDLVIDVDAMLSAAPAPEGGAVKGQEAKSGIREILRKQATDPSRYLNPTHAASEVVFADHDPEARFISGDYSDATREEPPAEAGEAIEARFPELNDDLIRMASTGSTGSLIEWGAFIERLKSALRAQPPAREDAQPVAWRYRLDDETAQALFRPGWNFQEHKPPVQWGPYGRLITEAEPLYTHPAPDALRAAVEALEKIKAVRVCKESANIWTGAGRSDG